MRTVGSLVLMVSLGLILLVGINATQSLSDEANASGDSSIVSQAASGDTVLSPIFLLLGFIVLIVGAIAAVNAFS
jgi:hypothetical protein